MAANPDDTTTNSAGTIVVAVDASAASERALVWCAQHAEGFGADRVVVVHVVHVPGCTPFAELEPELTVPVMDAVERDRVRALVMEDWCEPLREAGLEHHVVLFEATDARVLSLVASDERASLVVLTTGTGNHAPKFDCPVVFVP
jgi:hypothetical protein